MPIATPNRRPMHNRLAELRAERGWSRRDLAGRLSVNVQTVGSLERGQYSPSLYLALVIAAEFGLPVSEIFWLEGE